MFGQPWQQHQYFRHSAQLEFAPQLQATLKYVDMCKANTISIENNFVHNTELVMKAADSLIQESALYQSILLKSRAKEACQSVMDLITKKNMLSTIHPIMLAQAAQLLHQTEHEGLPALADRELLQLAI